MLVGVRKESVPPQRHVGSNWRRRIWLQQMIPANAFTMKGAEAAFPLMLSLRFAAMKASHPPSFFHPSWKDAISFPLWLLWCWVTQRLILEIIEIKLFPQFFQGAIISAAHNLLSLLNKARLAAVTYTSSLREEAIFLLRKGKWIQISEQELSHFWKGEITFIAARVKRKIKIDVSTAVHSVYCLLTSCKEQTYDDYNSVLLL